MPKKIFLTIIALIIVVAGGYWFCQSKKPAGKGGAESVFDPKNTTYSIEGNLVTLINGKAEKEITTGSASKIEIAVWGEPSNGDLSGDGKNDSALILTYGSGGSGTFYYIAAALQGLQSEKTTGTNAILLGDRIAPQNISIANRTIIVNYADRKSGEPMTTPPSVGIAKTFEIQGTVLREITSEVAKKEQACIISGGTIGNSLCCTSAADFPNSCLIGACGCSPANSHEIKVCDCGTSKCFDGTACVDTK